MIDSCPEKITIGQRGAKTVYTRAADFVAKPRNAVHAGDDVVLDDMQLPAVVVRVVDETSDDSLLPVYRIGESDELALPTGRIFVRVLDRSPLAKLKSALGRAGFRIDHVNEWAPYSGWVVPKTERPADALQKAPELVRKLNVHAEPEMISARRFKGGNQE